MVGGGGRRQVHPEHLDQHQLGQPGRQGVGAHAGRCRFLEGQGDAGLHPAGGRPRREPDDEGEGEDPHGRVEQRVLGVEVPADEVGAGPSSAVVDRRQDVPRRRGVEQREDRHALGRCLAPDGVPVAVGQHDHVSLGGPMALAVGGRHPARPLGEDVEEDQAVGAGVERVGQGQGCGLEGEPLGENGAEEDRPLEAELLERGLEQRRRRRNALVRGRIDRAHGRRSGVVASIGGASVMALRSVPPDTRT